MEIEMLINFFKKRFYISNSGYKLIEEWINELKGARFAADAQLYYCTLMGCIYGIYMTGYITNEDKEKLLDELFNLYCLKEKNLREEHL